MEEDQVAPTVVVGVDGSECSVAALQLAARLAPALNAQIRAVLCWDFPTFYTGYTPQGLDGYEKAADQALRNVVERAFGTPTPANVTTEVLQGSAPGILVDESRDARMLVLGRRGRGGFRGLMLGSVSAACVTYAGCPVLVVHEEDTNQWTREP